jgi:Protein of unknown function (DUF3467)
MAVGSEDPPPKTPLEGRYANYFKVGHNAFEFVFEFGQLYQGEEEPQMHTRIVTSPVYARELLRTLQQAMDQYESEQSR